MSRPGLLADRVLLLGAVAYALGLVVTAAAHIAPGGALGAAVPYADPLMVAVTFVALLWGRRAREKAERRFWDMLALAWLCLLLVEVVFFFDVSLPWVSASLTTDALYILFYLIFVLAVDLKPHLEAKRSLLLARRRLESVAGVMVVFGVLIYFAIVVLPEPLGISLSFVSRERGLTALLLVRLSLDLVLLGRLLHVGLSGRVGWALTYGLLAFTMLCFAVKDGLAVLLSAGLLSVAQPGLFYASFLSLPGFCVILAARCRPEPSGAAPDDATAADGDGGEQIFRTSPLALYALLVPALHFLFYPLGLLEPISRGPREVFSLIYLLILGTMAWIHQGLIIKDSRRARQELRKIEERLFRSQRMESVGRLAGGIAHDFNNYLTVIRGYAELLAERFRDPETQAEIGFVKDAADRATHLTRQLLALGRRQVLRPESLSLNSVVLDTGKLLESLLGEDVILQLELDPDTGLARADLGQTEQVLMNLALNSRDAMPGGGELSIRTSRIELSMSEATDLELGPGAYAVLEVADTGSGMTEEVLSQALEPFFTTKDHGKGTGLGLSTVEGIVAQTGGALTLSSSPERGTTVRVLLPSAATPTHRAPVPASRSRLMPSDATVLVVEDDDQVRALTVRALARHGFRVCEASGGRQALDRFAGFPPVDLLITDVMMPGMDGIELAHALVSRCPGLRVLFTSGYPTETLRERQAELPLSVPLLPKPFTPTALVAKVHEVLAERPPTGSLDGMTDSDRASRHPEGR